MKEARKTNVYVLEEIDIKEQRKREKHRREIEELMQAPFNSRCHKERGKYKSNKHTLIR